jgi:conjugative transfer signal peptidase TraF
MHKRIIAFCIIFLCMSFIGKKIGMIINLTDSMPKGIYVAKSNSREFQRGDIVNFCLPKPIQDFGLKRSYLEKGFSCHGSMPLIKKIIAVPGDNVLLTDQFISVNGQIHPFKTRYMDSLGRTLSVFPRGRYLDTQGFWLVGENDKSWDSRYWGPVERGRLMVILGM